MANKHPNTKGLIPLKKGYDPRRNLRGVPKDAIGGRKMLRKIGAELLKIQEYQPDGSLKEYEITRLEAMVRLKYASKAPEDFKTILKSLFPGILKDEVEIDGKVIFEVHYADDADKPPEAA